MGPPPPGHIHRVFDSESKNIERLSTEFAAEVKRVLSGVENRIKKLMDEYTATGKTNSIDLDFALTTRTQLKQILRDAGYYDVVETAVTQYVNVISGVRETYKLFGSKVTFSEIDRRTIKVLMQNDVADLGNIGDDALDQIYRSLVDSSIGGIPITDAIPAISAALEATDLAQYAYTYANTAYMDFYRRINNIAVENTEWAQVVYMGPVDEVTRPFCREHVGKVLTLDDAKNLKNDQGGNGYSEGGGWNCRHRWVSVPPDYVRSKEYDEYRDSVQTDLKATA